MDVGKRIKELRKQRGISAETIAEHLGTNPTTIYRYEKGDIEKMPITILEPIAKLLGCTPGYLMGWEDDKGNKVPPKDPEPRDPNKRPACFDVFVDAYAIPLLGRVAAGCPLYDEGNIIGKVYVSPDLHDTDELYALTVKGDSMIPRIHDGDVLIVKHQDDADSGQLVVVQINGNEGVVKKLQKYRDGIALVSLNPAYEPMHFSNDEIESLPVRVVGKVLEVRSKI